MGSPGKIASSILLLVLLAAPSLAGNVTTFEEGKTGAVAGFNAPQFVDIINITVPAQCHIRKATMNVSAVLPDKANPDCPENVRVCLNDTLLWQFNGTGYGPLGLQDRFINGTTEWKSGFNAGGGTNATRVRLPWLANIQNATMQVNCSGRGPIENNMNLTGKGQIVSDAGDVNGDGVVDLITGIRNGGGNNAYIFFCGPGMDTASDVNLTGEVSGDGFGSSVSGAGDVNGDGYDDVIAGAPSNDALGSSTGRAYIYFGGPNMDATADVVLTGRAPKNLFGSSVSGAGDVNGDGFDDVVVSAPGNDSGGTDAGQLYIFFGGASMDSTADVVCTGAAANYNLGYAVSGAGDVDKDGYDDVIAGTYSGGANHAYIYRGGAAMDGTADIVLTGGSDGGRFGEAVSDAGDVNADGYDDVLVGSPYANGKGFCRGCSYLFLGGSSMDGNADLAFYGEVDMDELGEAVSGAGDVNNDGYDDVILGSRLHSPGGAAYLHLGGAAMDSIPDVIFDGPTKDGFGYSVSGAGDIDDDGYDDFAIGMNDRSWIGIYDMMAGIKNASVSVGPINLLADTWYLNGTNTTRDFGPELDSLVKNSSYSGVDGYGISYIDLPVQVKAGSLGNITLEKLGIVYSFGAALSDFTDRLNEYIDAHQAEKDASGNLTIPIVVRSATPGRLRLSDLSIIADEPPTQTRTIPDFEMDQGALRWDLVDLPTYFQDDYNSAETLRYSLVSATNTSTIEVSITGNRYLSVDASMFEHWTGTTEVVVACADSQNQSVRSNPFTIYIGAVPHPGTNLPPVFTTRWPQQAFISEEYVYEVNATDPENDTLTFGLDKKPQSMTIDTGSGRISWVPSAVGSYDVSVFVTDGCSTVFQKFTVAVPNRPPHVTGASVPYAYVGVPFLFRVPAEDDDGDLLTFSLESAPDGSMTIDRSSGMINWTPAFTGPFTASFAISDGKESVYYRCFITVLQGNRAPKFQTVPVTTAYVGLRYIYDANATDVDGDRVNYSLVQGPDGMTIDNSTGRISWMPGGPGNCPVVLKASDGKGGETLQEFTIVVSGRVKPRVQITDPAENQTLKGKVSVTGRTFRGTLDIARVQVRIDGSSWNDADGNSSWKYTLDTTRLKNGKHTIEARAYDGMDYSDTVSRAFVVDNPKTTGKGFIPGFSGIAAMALFGLSAMLLMRKRGSE